MSYLPPAVDIAAFALELMAASIQLVSQSLQTSCTSRPLATARHIFTVHDHDFGLIPEAAAEIQMIVFTFSTLTFLYGSRHLSNTIWLGSLSMAELTSEQACVVASTVTFAWPAQNY